MIESYILLLIVNGLLLWYQTEQDKFLNPIALLAVFLGPIGTLVLLIVVITESVNKKL